MRSARSLFRPAAFTLAAAAISLPSHAAWTNLDWSLPDSLQAAQPTPPVIAQDAPAGDDLPRLSAEELDELLGPIALYPDVLLSAVLAAAVYPDQVAAAAVLVRNGATGEQLEGQGWEDPVVAVAKVPEVIILMGNYPDWTRALGSAFLIQSWEVMDSVQRLRGIAFENGALQTTAQHVITVEQQTQHIIIAPANPTVIFVPQYNPSVVFVRDDRRVANAALIGFGTGVAVGAIIWGGSSNWNGGFVSWGRGGWWGWNNNNNRTNINIDNSRNININRPGGDRINIGGGGGRDRLPNRIGNEGNRWTPDRNRPGLGGSGTGPGGSNINRDRINDWRENRPNSRPPGSSNNVPPNRPNIGGNRPGAGGGDRPSINRPGGGGGTNIGNRPTPTPPAGGRPPVNRPGVGGGTGGAGNRPSMERPTTLPARPTTPTTRPGVGGGATGNPATRPGVGGGTRAPGAINRPTTLPARPAGTPTTGNRTSAFSGGPGNAAANRGAASRAAAGNRAAGAGNRGAAAGAARGGGGGGGGGRGGGGGGGGGGRGGR